MSLVPSGSPRQEVLEAAGRFDEQYRVRERAVLAAAPRPGSTAG